MNAGWSRELVLLGAGHSHVLALRMLAMRPPAGTRLTLVSDTAQAPYSGMLPGLVAGHYRFDEMHIDARRYCARLGARFVEAAAVGLDLGRRELLFARRPPLAYDALSLDIGSQPELASVPGAAEHAVAVKPIASFHRRWQAVLARARAGGGMGRICVVGGGAGSVELALAMAFRLRGGGASLALVCGRELLPGYSGFARRAVRERCRRWAVRIHERNPVASVAADSLRLADGSSLRQDAVFWCTQAAAPPWLAETGLATDGGGFVQVDDRLLCLGQRAVFAAGDIASQVGRPRPKAGVFAVRQAPTLAANLRAALTGAPLRRFRPQRRFLAMLSLGGPEAVAQRGPLQVAGAWVWRWKRAIDIRFMRQFERLPARMPAPPQPEGDAMHCGGCGAKLPGGELRAVLRELARQYPEAIDPRALAEDAAPLEPPAGRALVQSVDVLRELVDDCWLMGRIAALHALSDLYAMGAEPLSALAQVQLPYAARCMQRADLHALLAGACHELAGAGARLAGGHTLEGPELSVGFTVNGSLAGPALRKTGGAAGDRLILTKPLGTGVLFAAHRQGRARGDWLASALATMLQSNAGAARRMREHGAGALTDVTGFGLLGHLAEMLSGGRLAAELCRSAVPLLEGVEAGFAGGSASTLQAGNIALAAPLLDGGYSAAASEIQPLFDPQTSGGLLAAVHPRRAEALLLALRQSGYARAADIGHLAPAARAGIRIR